LLWRAAGGIIGALRWGNKQMAGGADVQINIQTLAITPEETLEIGRFYTPRSSRRRRGRRGHSAKERRRRSKPR
jgi:hypothetical protein